MLKLASIRLFVCMAPSLKSLCFSLKKILLNEKNREKYFNVHTQNIYWSVFSVRAHINVHTVVCIIRLWLLLLLNMGNPWFDATFINYTWFGIVSVFITPHRHAISTNPLRFTHSNVLKQKPKIKKPEPERASEQETAKSSAKKGRCLKTIGI